MSTLTLRVEAATAQKIINAYEEELAAVQKRAREIELNLAEMRKAVQDAPEVTATPVVAKNHESGRVKKGESAKAILAFLNTHKGSGWTQSQIALKTGTSMSTAGRVLKQLTKAGEIDSSGSTWAAPS